MSKRRGDSDQIRLEITVFEWRDITTGCRLPLLFSVFRNFPIELARRDGEVVCAFISLDLKFSI